ncbi:DNA-binding transcriptional regulator, MarR family [Poseidonocella sedimentorum]|uniref:DNA-binding transcriptional regulator, MarR family n=2 Tax=Poseidonocella sedimentorum TaxID=871652 RepID=A0A1I6D4T7_9RHOB|nr:DNA-binding transcriptional regulator, MarR family [Poseidonocella sedimentorum]
MRLLTAPIRMDEAESALAVALFSEIFTADQLLRSRLTRVLPAGMEISHFSVLNQLARASDEKTPAQLARSFHVTRGAMTNTLRRLESAGHVHIRPDWDDARRKRVTISPAGLQARDDALAALSPLISQIIGDLGQERARAILPILRDLRAALETD